jgi:hypothetical protein
VAVTEPLWFAAKEPAFKVKEPVLEPAGIESDKGAERSELPALRAILAPPFGAALLKVTVQVEDEFGPREAGLHDIPESTAGVTRSIGVLTELELYVAFTVEVWSLGIAVVLAVNFADVAPAAIGTDAGMAKTVPVLVSDMLAPPPGAPLLNVTVHADDAFGPNAAGLHNRLEITAGAARLIELLTEVLLYVAVSVEVWSLGMVVVLAVKVPEVAPAVMGTDPGIVNTVPVLVRDTLAPPAGAPLLSVTVHVEDAFGPNEAGLHASVEITVAITKLTVVFADLLL